MNYQIFQYTPSSASGQAPSSPTGLPAAGDTAPQRPVRVTPSALSALLYAILYSIEFQSPVGPRPPALRDHTTPRGGLGAAGGGGGGGGGAATAPSAATLLTSAVSVMSSFWGRSSATLPAAQQQAQQRQSQAHLQQQALEPSYRTSAGATSAVFPGSFDVAPGAVPRQLSAAEAAELAALQRQHGQPFVVPVIQVLHKLGGVHITVRETHNPTITVAYNRAMEEIEAIVSDHELRLTRQPPPPLPAPQPAAFPSPGTLPSGSAPGFTDAGGASAAAVDQQHQSISTNDRLVGSTRVGSTASPHSQPRAVPPGAPPSTRAAAPSPASPTPSSPSRSAVCLEGSPVSDAAAATWSRISANSDGGNQSNANGGGSSGAGGGDASKPGPDEVGLLFTVRLLSKEVTRWRLAHERPLAEWRFPIIRTSNERMIRSRMQGPTDAAGAEDGSAGGGGSATSRRHLRGDGAASLPELMLVNDPSQVLQVLEFILRSSYQTTSMETFTDFTSGELVFDAHVQESDFS